MEKVKQDALLGVVFFAALAVLLAVTLLLTNFSFRDRPKLEVLFQNAGGLERGDAVYVLGRRAGEVLDIRIRSPGETHRIAVDIQFEADFDLRADARIEIVDANLLGGKRVEIEPGRAAARAAEGPLFGTLKKGAIDALGDELQGEGGLLTGLKQAVDKLNQGQGTLARLLGSGQLHDLLVAAADDLVASLRAIREGRGWLGSAIHDEAMAGDARELVRSARSIAAKIDTGDGPLAAVLNDQPMAQQLRDAVADVAVMTRDLRAGEGTAGLLLRDPATRSKVGGIVDDVAVLLARARDPSAGVIGALLGDPALLDDVRTALHDARSFMDRATHGNGIVARLVNDEDWGRRFNQILGQVQRAIEDAREAAPVGTFFQVLTGFF